MPFVKSRNIIDTPRAYVSTVPCAYPIIQQHPAESATESTAAPGPEGETTWTAASGTASETASPARRPPSHVPVVWPPRGPAGDRHPCRTCSGTGRRWCRRGTSSAGPEAHPMPASAAKTWTSSLTCSRIRPCELEIARFENKGEFACLLLWWRSWLTVPWAMKVKKNYIYQFGCFMEEIVRHILPIVKPAISADGGYLFRCVGLGA